MRPKHARARERPTQGARSQPRKLESRGSEHRQEETPRVHPGIAWLSSHLLRCALHELFEATIAQRADAQRTCSLSASEKPALYGFTQLHTALRRCSSHRDPAHWGPTPCAPHRTVWRFQKELRCSLNTRSNRFVMKILYFITSRETKVVRSDSSYFQTSTSESP